MNVRSIVETVIKSGDMIAPPPYDIQKDLFNEI